MDLQAALAALTIERFIEATQPSFASEAMSGLCAQENDCVPWPVARTVHLGECSTQEQSVITQKCPRSQWHAHRCLCAALCLAAAPAFAEEGRALQWRASLGATHDSNLLRLPAAANVALVTGRSSASDNIATGTFSVLLDRDLGLQSVKASVSGVSQRFERFDYLDNAALNHSLSWNWAITPRLRGLLSSSRTQSLGDLADLSALDQRNQRMVRTDRFEAEYGLRGPWGAVFGVGRNSISNSQPTQAETDFSARSASFGAQINFASGSQVAARLRTAEGDYVNRSPSALSLFDNRYSERGAELSLRWLLSGKSSTNFNLVHFSRSHPTTPQRDYVGNAGALRLNWTATGKFALQADLVRELATFQALDANYVVTDRLTLAPTWQMGPRSQLQLNLQRAHRRYAGEPFGPLPAGLVARKDTSTDIALGFTWRPERAWVVSAAVQRLRRDANRVNLDFRATAATASLQFIF